MVLKLLKKSVPIYIIIICLMLNLISATSVGTADLTEGKVVYTPPPPPVFNNATANVNSSENWITTSLGTLGDANDTHFNNEAGALAIDQSWLSGFGNSIWCALTGCTMSGNIDMGNNNVTNVGWFKGLFNWVVLNNYTGFPYLNFNGSTLNLDQNALDDRIANQTASITYNATVIATDEGTLDSGNLASVQKSKDGDTYNVSEVGGSSPLLVQVNFSGVEDFNTLIIREKYIGGSGHEIDICLWDYGVSDWECEYGEITDMDNFAFTNIPVTDPSDHLSGNLVQLKFDHVQSGNPAHDLFLDYIVLVEGFTTVTTSSHDALSGRDNESNHPWALEVSELPLENRTVSYCGNITGATSDLCTITDTNDSSAINDMNASWLSTDNETYDAKADYQFLNNNFNGSGNFTGSYGLFDKVGVGIIPDASKSLQVLGDSFFDGYVIVDTLANAQPVYITRLGSTAESLSIGVDDSIVYFTTKQDEVGAGVEGSMVFVLDTGAIPYYDFRAGATSLMRILENGNVGIGVLSPARALQVSGRSMLGGVFIGGEDIITIELSEGFKLFSNSSLSSQRRGGFAIENDGNWDVGIIMQESNSDNIGEKMEFLVSRVIEMLLNATALYLDSGLEVSENATFRKDVIIDGILFGGSPVKISGINITNNVFMLEENLNSSSRFTLKNLNDGSNATSIISTINNVGGSMSIGIGSSNFMIGAKDYKNVTALFSKSRGDMVFANFFNQSFKWLYNPSDDGDKNNLEDVMILDYRGLNLTTGSIFLGDFETSVSGGSKVVKRSNANGALFGIENRVAGANPTSGAGYISIADGGNYTVDLHSSLDTNNPNQVVHHLRGDIFKEIWRTDPTTLGGWSFEKALNDPVFSINATGEFAKVFGNLNVTGNLVVDGCIQYNCSDSCITLGSCL